MLEKLALQLVCYNFENILKSPRDGCDMFAIIITVVLFELGWRNCLTTLVSILTVLKVDMTLYWRIINASFDNSLHCERIQVYSTVLIFNGENRSHMGGDLRPLKLFPPLFQFRLI